MGYIILRKLHNNNNTQQSDIMHVAMLAKHFTKL